MMTGASIGHRRTPWYVGVLGVRAARADIVAGVQIRMGLSAFEELERKLKTEQG